MQVFVIDDNGKVWEGGDREFRDAFYLNGIDGDMSPQLIDKMGFVGLTSHSGTTLVVRFNPETIAKPALSGLYAWLHEHPYGRLCLAYGPGSKDVIHKIVAGRGSTGLGELETLIEQARGPQLPFISLPDAVEDIRDVPALAGIFDLWKSHDGLYVEEEYRPLLNSLARDRYSIFEPNPVDGAIEIVSAGNGLQIPDRESHAALQGARLDEVAGAFGPWAAVSYREVLERQKPRFDHIYARIQWPRVGEVERRYSRMILPCRTATGRQLLLGVNSERDFGPPHVDGKAA